MPEEIKDKLTWLFLLAPGFVSVTTIGTIVDLGQLSEFQITYYSFVLTAADVAIALVLIYAWKGIRRICTNATPGWTVTQTIVMAMLVSLVTGIGLGLAGERDWFFLTLRSLPVTETLNKRSSSRPVPFLLSQNTSGRLKSEGDARPNKVTEAWVRLTLKNDRQYEGWPEFYGLDKERSEIYLSPACELTGKTKRLAQKIRGPGVIVYEDEIATITLLDRGDSACFLTWFPQPSTKAN